MSRHLVVGLGEVGTAVLLNLLEMNYEVDTLDVVDQKLDGEFGILHICFPYSDSFIEDVEAYQKKYSSKCTIIYSTVPIGTTKKIPDAVHSPIEGRHPRLEYSVKKFKRYIGYNNFLIAQQAAEVWDRRTEVELVSNSDFTEFLKLASTSKFGINVVWAQYMADTARQLGMEYSLVKDWDKAYNNLYTELKMPWARKFVLDAPNGRIGGHCVRENSIILDEIFPNDMLKMIYAMKGINEKVS